MCVRVLKPPSVCTQTNASSCPPVLSGASQNLKNTFKIMNLWIKSGVTRHVIITARYAFKIPNFRNGWSIFLCGLLANLSENEWGCYRDCAIPPNKPLWCCPGGWLSVYRRAQPYDGPMIGLDWSPWGDHKRANLGTINGKLVVIDFDMSGRNPQNGED